MPKPYEPPQCICGAWADPDDYEGAMWDRSEDWCPLHSWRRRRTLAAALRARKRGEITQEQHEAIKAK